MNKTSIIILTYNNLNYNQLCIDSIRTFTNKEDYEIIVIDNHSTDGTAEWLKEQNDIKLILNKDNKGFPAGCNQGINAAAAGNDILLLNNDTIVTPKWLDTLRACLYSESSIGAVGPVTNSCSNLQAVVTDYKDFDELISFAAKINISDSSKWEERVRLIGFCLLIKNETVKKVGLLDEMYGTGNYEDDDYSLRIRKEGYRLMMCGDCFIHHFGNASFSKERTAYNDVLQSNRKKFTLKWGVDPMLFTIDERSLLAPYSDKIKAAGNVLVVNSGCGSMLFFLKKNYPQSCVSGIETNNRLAIELEHAAKFYWDFDTLPKKKFDLIIVLTIMRNDIDVPAQFEKLPPLLTDGGHILLTADIDKIMGYAHSSFFKEFHISVMQGTAILKKLPAISINHMSQIEINRQDYSISPETAGEDQLAFLIRRIENGIDDQENTENLGRVLTAKQFSATVIENIVQKLSIHKALAFNAIGTAYYNAGQKQQGVEMFADAYAEDKTFRDGVFNLAYGLFEAKEKKLALKVIDGFGAADGEMCQLRQAVLALV